MTSSRAGARTSTRLGPARGRKKPPHLSTAWSPRLKTGVSSPALQKGGTRGPEPGGHTGETTPTQGPTCPQERAGPVSPHGQSAISRLEPGPETRDPAPACPSVAQEAAPRPTRERAEAGQEEVRAAGSLSQPAPQAPHPQAAPPLPPAPRPGSAGGRREGAGSGHGGRHRTPTALPHATPRCGPDLPALRPGRGLARICTPRRGGGGEACLAPHR